MSGAMPANVKYDKSVSAGLHVRPLAAAWALCGREWVRFFRQRNRVVGAIGQPLLFWLLFGAGMNRVFQVDGQNFREYYFPGTIVLILLFTAIFATISIIEDRREGFLQSVLVAPTPRWSMVLGKVLGGTLIALAQGLLFLLLVFTLKVRFDLVTIGVITVWLFAVAFGFTSLGFVIAWRMESTQGFHAIMSLVLMPMWLLSGAFFPVPALRIGASAAEYLMHGLMRINPTTYAVGGLRRLLYANMDGAPASITQPGDMWLPTLASCWIVVIGFGLLMYVIASKMSVRPARGDLL